ncbi:TlpA family protein disulfide reductase [Lentzea sp. NPDC051213]|uniref:TlpA family protein disulfide reductase n=1 Tax=Lentzea sp. NPDC051213 TaxID=3364126 RepID=UPI0037A52076
MAQLIGLVAVGLLGLFNLVLAFGLVRRMREHADLISRLSDVVGGRSSAGAIVGVGTRVPPFRVTALDNGIVDRDRLPSSTLVGFFSPGCTPCEELLPGFVAAARAMPNGKAGVIAVVVSEEFAGEYLDVLGEVATVVVEGRKGALGVAFGVTSYPATCTIDATGTVTSTRLAVPAGV